LRFNFWAKRFFGGCFGGAREVFIDVFSISVLDSSVADPSFLRKLRAQIIAVMKRGFAAELLQTKTPPENSGGVENHVVCDDVVTGVLDF
jgi:hypothetical protein